jgi:DNA polymerase III delta prime subunit
MSDVIIPDSVKAQFQAYADAGEIPNLLLTSTSPGTGKTTTARAICRDIGIERPLFINASLNNSIDNIRMDVTQYATTMSLYDGVAHKVVILDEADRLTPAAQDSLKGLIEEVYSNCRFIMTANRKSGIIAPLQSRLTQIDFKFSKDDEKRMLPKMFKRILEILDIEQVTYDKKVVASIVQKVFPDNRQLLIFLQGEAQKGAIDEGSLARLNSMNPEFLVEAMKAKKYNDVREWVANNADRLNDDFYDQLFKMLETKLVDQSIPQTVLILGDAQKYHTVVPSKFLHFLSVSTELMMQVQFK